MAEPNRLIVRVSSSTYNTEQGFEYKRTVNVLRRKSQLCLYDLIGSVDESPPLNLHDVKDGIYELRAANIETDSESGYADNWDTELVALDGQIAGE